jgi:hypothetical protein
MLFNRSRFSVAEYYHLWRQDMEIDASLTAIEEKETAVLDALAEFRPVYIVDFEPNEETLDVYVYLPTILYDR